MKTIIYKFVLYEDTFVCRLWKFLVLTNIQRKMKTQMSSKGLDVLLVIENKTVKLIPSAFHVKKKHIVKSIEPIYVRNVKTDFSY